MDNMYMFQYTNRHSTMNPEQKPINANQLMANLFGRGASNYPTWGTIPTAFYPVPNGVGLPTSDNRGY